MSPLLLAIVSDLLRGLPIGLALALAFLWWKRPRVPKSLWIDGKDPIGDGEIRRVGTNKVVRWWWPW